MTYTDKMQKHRDQAEVFAKERVSFHCQALMAIRERLLGSTDIALSVLFVLPRSQVIFSTKKPLKLPFLFLHFFRNQNYKWASRIRTCHIFKTGHGELLMNDP